MRVSDLMNPKGILLYANIDNRADALGILVELQEGSGIITNGTAYYNAVYQRETFGGSTAIGNGIALPHAGAGDLGPDPAPGRGLGRAGWACGRSYFYDRRTAGGRKPSSADFGAAGQSVGVWNIGGRAAPCQPFGTLSGTDPESGKYLFWRLSLGIRPGAAANGRGSGRAPAFFGEKREKRGIRSGKIGDMIHCFSAAKCAIL